MDTKPKSRTVTVAPKGWTEKRAGRVLAVEGMRVSERTGRILSQSPHGSPQDIRKKIIDAVKK